MRAKEAGNERETWKHQLFSLKGERKSDRKLHLAIEKPCCDFFINFVCSFIEIQEYVNHVGRQTPLVAEP